MILYRRPEPDVDVLDEVIAMCVSFIIWYVPNEHPAGAIVILWFFTFVESYFLVVHPKHRVLIIFAIVTQGNVDHPSCMATRSETLVLIIGYELEVKRVGVKVRSPETKASDDLIICRWRQVPASQPTEHISSRHIDLLLSSVALSPPPSGLSFHTHCSREASYAKILEHHCPCWRTSTASFARN